MLKPVLLVSFLIVMAGCASNTEDRNKNSLTMAEAHKLHQKMTYGDDIEKARESWQVVDNKQEGRLLFDDDLRLPNPELEMVVFPTRLPHGGVRPSYKIKFPMYRNVHYKVGQ